MDTAASAPRFNVFMIAELRDEIMEYDKSVAAKVALLQKGFVESARRIIWRDVDEPCALFKLIAPVHCPQDPRDEHEFILDELPTQEALRKLAAIAGLVHTLCQSSHTCAASVRQILAIVCQTQGRPLLPNLLSLDAATMGLALGTEIPLLCASLTSLTCILPSEYHMRSLSDTIDDYVRFAAGLESITFITLANPEEHGDSTFNALARLAERLPHLQAVNLPVYYLTDTVLCKLASSTVSTLGFSHCDYSLNSGDPVDVLPACWMSDPGSLPHGSFASLRVLALCATLEAVAALINHPHFPSMQLLDLTVRAVQHEPAESVQQLHLAIGAHCLSLKSLCLNLSPPIDPNEALWPAGVDASQFGLDALIPLVNVHTLEQFSIVHRRPLQVADGELATLCIGWPRMQYLALNPVPSTQEPPTLTLLSLIDVAHHCPDIRELALYVNAAHNSAYPTGHAPHRFSASLARLCIAASHINQSTRQSVAAFLSRVLSPTTILCAYDARFDDAGHVDLASQVTADPNAAWNFESHWSWVTDILPILLLSRVELVGY
ncbi:hypothetical protein PENSPDRAFT_691432 [Peniophora sp. CONT]|nr:hypothetical protein PENSPDRAFT_691432 [Peniophora sp. CONT]